MLKIKCCKCDIEKSNVHMYNKDYCKKCMKEFGSEIEITNKVCFECEIDKAITEYYKNISCIDGRARKCIDCAKKEQLLRKPIIKKEEFSEKFYNEFIEKKIIKTENELDTLTPTLLYPYFKNFCKKKTKYLYCQAQFSEDLSKMYFGKLKGKKWVGVKLIDEI